jgi:hypothetical protein
VTQDKLAQIKAIICDDCAAPKDGERAVLVTTAHRGVFFGYATDTSGDTIKLRRARNCIYWPASQRGFLGLASDGPQNGARVGPAVDLEVRAITSVAECTPAAVAAWEAAPWA